MLKVVAEGFITFGHHCLRCPCYGSPAVWLAPLVEAPDFEAFGAALGFIGPS